MVLSKEQIRKLYISDFSTTSPLEPSRTKVYDKGRFPDRLFCFLVGHSWTGMGGMPSICVHCGSEEY